MRNNFCSFCGKIGTLTVLFEGLKVADRKKAYICQECVMGMAEIIESGDLECPHCKAEKEAAQEKEAWPATVGEAR